jgi:hypothetical protein
MHSAKEVIYNELKEQYERGSLSNLELPDDDDDIVGKQYLIKYKNNKNNKNCTLIIGTIDSFMYAIGNKDIRDNDYFSGIVKSIKVETVLFRPPITISYTEGELVKTYVTIIYDDCKMINSHIPNMPDIDCTHR